MKIQQPFLAVGLLFSGACLSKALKKETAVPQAPVENQPLEAADDPFACAKHEDCETDELCFVDTCVLPSFEMSCSLPEDSRLGQLSSGAEGGTLNTACVFMVDADGNGTEEILKVARDLNRSMIDIDIVDTDTLQLQHFEVSTENALFDSPHVRFEVIPKEFSGKPLLKIDVPGREACDSASYNYYLSYEPSKGIQIAIRTVSVSGEVGSFDSTATFSPDGTLQYREERERYEADTGIASAKPPAPTDPPPRRMCLNEGVYVDCPEGEAPITLSPNAPLSKGVARLNGVPTKICNECEGCDTDNVCATHHDFPSCGLQPCCDGSIEFEGACSVCPEGTSPDASKTTCVPENTP